MDDRVSSAAYNPVNDFDISTARGMQNLQNNGRDFVREPRVTSQSIKVGLAQIALFVILSVFFAIIF